MYVNISIYIKPIKKTIKPKGFYYKGEGENTKIIIVGTGAPDCYKKQTFKMIDCDISLTKVNAYGDSFTI